MCLVRVCTAGIFCECRVFCEPLFALQSAFLHVDIRAVWDGSTVWFMYNLIHRPCKAAMPLSTMAVSIMFFTDGCATCGLCLDHRFDHPQRILWQPVTKRPLCRYGAYEICNDPYFSSARVSLLDRGVIFAIAHIRGGGEMGRCAWSRAHWTWVQVQCVPVGMCMDSLDRQTH